MKKETLYIFVHLHKTGGTTLNKHIEKNYKKDKVLFLYYDKLGLSPFASKKPDYKKLARDAILKLTPAQRKKIKIISGHFLPKDIAKYFLGREIRFITIVRNPFARAKSMYNYFRTLYEKEDTAGKNKQLYKSFLKLENKVPDFNNWLRKKFGNPKSGVVTHPISTYFSDLGYKLSDFYFVGVTKNLPNDLPYLYKLLDIKKFFIKQNISKNFIKDNFETEKWFRKKYKKSYEIYKNAEKEAQKQDQALLDGRNLLWMKIKIKIVTPFTQIFFDFPESIHMLSAYFRKKFRLYNFLMNKIKGGGYSKLAFVNTFWSGFLRITLRSLTFIKLAILARILTPNDFGILGIASLVLAFLEIISETGINVFLIQEKNKLKNYLDTAYVVSIIRGVLISLVILLLAKPVSLFFNSPTSFPLIILIAAVSFIRGFINPAVVKFRINLQFQKEYILQSVIFLSETIVAVVASLILRSAIGIIWGMIAGATLEVFLTHILIKPRPKIRFENENFKKIVGRGKWMTAAGVFNYLFENVDDMTVGKMLNQSSLGIYQVAYKISSLPITEISTVINRVSLPIYTKISSDLERLRKAYLKSFVSIMSLVVPVGLILFFFPAMIVTILLGDKWTSAVEIIRVMAFFGIIRAVSLSTYPLFLSIKRQDIVTKITLANIIFLSLGLIILVKPLGLVGVGISAIIGSLAGIPVSIYYLFKIFK